MDPFNIATGGYLGDPLCVATDGYICVTAVVSGRGGLSKRQKILRRQALEDDALMRQIVREDEELISLIVTSIQLF